VVLGVSAETPHERRIEHADQTHWFSPSLLTNKKTLDIRAARPLLLLATAALTSFRFEF